MPRIVALFLIVSYFLTAAVPVSARGRAQERTAQADSPAAGSSCELAEPFRGVHNRLIAMAAVSHDAGQTALRLHHTSRSIPYKHIEREVAGLEEDTKGMFRRIADLSFSADSLPDGDDGKQTAALLASTYQNVAEQIIDYAHASVDYERTENAFDSFIRARTVLTYSISGYQKVRTYWDNITRHHLDERYTEIGDALRSLALPEYLYAKICMPSSPQAKTRTINDPCEAAGTLADMRTAINEMGKFARDSGNTAHTLHKTTLSHPYKRVENDWISLTSKINPTLDTLTDLSVRLNGAPDDDKKTSALALIATYQETVEQFVDYSHLAIYYERNENDVATNSYGLMLGNSAKFPGSLSDFDGESGSSLSTKSSSGSSLTTSFSGGVLSTGMRVTSSDLGTPTRDPSTLGLDGGVLGMPTGGTRAVLGFGLTRDSVKSNMETTAMNLFEARYTEADDAFRGLKLPQARFDRACGMRSHLPPAFAGLSPCGASKDMISMHAAVLRLGEEVRDMDAVARHLHHTTRSRPYKYIEKTWSNVTFQSGPLLDELSDLIVALDADQDTAKKNAALDLSAAYQGALERLVDSGHLAVYYERAENMLGTSFYSDKSKLNFGVSINPPRNGGDNVARSYLEGKALQANDAFRSLKLPEYRYGKLCKIAISPLRIKRRV